MLPKTGVRIQLHSQTGLTQTKQSLSPRPPAHVHCHLQSYLQWAPQGCVAVDIIPSLAVFTAVSTPMTLDSNPIQVSRMNCSEDQDGRGNGESEEGIRGAVLLATFAPNNWALGLNIFLTFHFDLSVVHMCLLLWATLNLFWKQVAYNFLTNSLAVLKWVSGLGNSYLKWPQMADSALKLVIGLSAWCIFILNIAHKHNGNFPLPLKFCIQYIWLLDK